LDILLWLYRILVGYPRRNPLTFGYLMLLAASWALLRFVLTPAAGHRLLEAISTNLDNLPHHPLLAPFGSLLVVDTSASLLFLTLIVGFGVACCFAVLERQIGAARAIFLGVTGHLAATLASLGLIALALRHGWYPSEVRSELDYGVSYLATTAAAAVTALIRPLLLAAGYALIMLALPFTNTIWYGWLPDFITVGHLCAALFGLAMIGYVRAANTAMLYRLHNTSCTANRCCRDLQNSA